MPIFPIDHVDSYGALEEFAKNDGSYAIYKVASEPDGEHTHYYLIRKAEDEIEMNCDPQIYKPVLVYSNKEIVESPSQSDIQQSRGHKDESRFNQNNAEKQKPFILGPAVKGLAFVMIVIVAIGLWLAYNRSSSRSFFNLASLNPAQTQQKTINNPDGSVYVGEVVNDIPNGQGILTLQDGSTYEGEFKNGKLNGQGKFTNKSTYHWEKGEFKDGKLNGQGEKHDQEGVFVGTFKDGRLDGEGHWESGSTGDRFIGIYKEGRLVDKATIEYANGNKYVGNTNGDLLEGFGTITYANGDQYTGEFENDLPTGEGKYICADGIIIDPNFSASEVDKCQAALTPQERAYAKAIEAIINKNFRNRWTVKQVEREFWNNKSSSSDYLTLLSDWQDMTHQQAIILNSNPLNSSQRFSKLYDLTRKSVMGEFMFAFNTINDFKYGKYQKYDHSVSEQQAYENLIKAKKELVYALNN